MSLTSCYKYVIELPETSISGILRSVIAQGETAPIPLTFHQEDRPVGDYLVTVDASLIDSAAQPSSVDLTATNLEAVLHLRAEIDATVQDLDGLNPIVYEASFQVPSTVAVDHATTPPWLVLQVGTLSGPQLGLTLTGGALDYTATLFDGPVHEFYASSPGLHLIVKNVSLLGLNKQVRAYIYDTTETPITVELPSLNTLRIHFPGKLEVWTAVNPQTKESTAAMTITVDVDVQIGPDPDDTTKRLLTVLLSTVTQSDVTVDLVWEAPAPVYAAAVPALMAPEVVTKLHSITDPERRFPSDSVVAEMVTTELASFLSNQSWKLIPLDSAGSDFDLPSAVPITVAAHALALQVEPEDVESVPCDGPDDFTDTSDIATAVSAIEVQRRLEVFADNVNGMNTQVAGYDVTLNRPSLWLEDPNEHDVAEGHIWAEGTAVVHVGGCVGDVDANYAGPLTLRPVTQPDGTVKFEVEAGAFQGDTDAKDKKEDFDPAVFQQFLESQNWDFPLVPTRFQGVGDVSVNFNRAEIDRRGIRLYGTVTVQTLNASMYGTVLPRSAFWAMEGAGGG